MIGVIEGVRELQRYLTLGETENLEVARQTLTAAANASTARRDLDSRWVAAHLVDLCDDLGASSVWSLLPDGTPPEVGRSMTLGDPPVLTLWPPQVRLLGDPGTSPLQPQVRRSVLTFPTSAGKTLISQLLIAQHLSVVGTGVCFVAPSHSLCREVREGLDRRLWALRKSIASDGPLGDRKVVTGSVVVMTPEKFAARLRSGEEALLEEFGLFVLDEAHLLGDDVRGWTFESTISRLHSITENSPHRLILVSAALGGTASIQTWLGIDGPAAARTSTWRGPRRLHATYTYREDPGSKVVIPAVGQQRYPRTSMDFYGVVDLYVDGGASVAQREERLDPIVTAGGKPKRPSRSKQLLPIVGLAARSGPVLTVHATKIGAERLAVAIAEERAKQALADRLGERINVLPLVKLAEERLGEAHGLVGVLRHGVAYHHAALPGDIQAEIEDAVRRGVLDIVCATTTLTEGINLPVRTVIVCDRGYRDKAEYHLLIGPAALMNAAGRAGRAGRETEGWVVINYEFGAPSPRQAIRDLDAPKEVRSTLNVAAALEALGEYEDLIHATAGLLLAEVPAVVDGFLAYCWYLADVADVLNQDDRRSTVIKGLRHTLAWHQLPTAVQSRWEAIAERVTNEYEIADPIRQRRWARSGMRLSANAVLEQVARGAAAALAALGTDDSTDPLLVLRTILSDGRLAALLGLVDERDYRFKRRRYGLTEIVQVDLAELVLDWVRGESLGDLVTKHLSEVADAEDGGGYRFEQLSTFLTRICETSSPIYSRYGTRVD